MLKNIAKMIIVDVGGGLHTEYFKLLHKYGSLNIYTFEPHPDLYKKLSLYKSPTNGANGANSADEIKEYERLTIYQKAVSDSVNKNVNFFCVNDPCASSLLPLNGSAVKKWKYPLHKPTFKSVETIFVDTTTLKDFSNQLNKNNIMQELDLIFIDVQGTELKVLRGITPIIFKHTKRIIVKCIDVDFELHIGQDDIVDIIDHLEIYGFGIVRTESYSHGQEKIIEFVNTQKITPVNPSPWLKLEKTGKITININV